MEHTDLPPREDLIDHIDEETSNLHSQTIEAMVDIVIYVEKSEGSVRTAEIKEEVEKATNNSIKRAVNRTELLEKFSPTGGKNFFLHAAEDEIFFSPDNISEEDFKRMYEEVQMLLDDAQTDEKKRELLSDKFDCDEDISSIREAVSASFENDHLGCTQAAGEVIQKIKQSEDLQREYEYDEMGWRRRPNRYGVHEEAYNLGEA